MEDTRITFETAKLAKEKGFPQEPNRLKIPYYNYKGEFKGDVKDWLRKYLRKEDTSDVESVSAPTQSLLAKWLREKHNIHVTSRYDIVLEKGYGYTLYFFMEDKGSFVNKELISYIYKTYEEAYEIGLYQALLLL